MFDLDVLWHCKLQSCAQIRTQSRMPPPAARMQRRTAKSWSLTIYACRRLCRRRRLNGKSQMTLVLCHCAANMFRKRIAQNKTNKLQRVMTLSREQQARANTCSFLSSASGLSLGIAARSAKRVAAKCPDESM
eukprot:4560799-Amphidinium_carterae.1